MVRIIKANALTIGSVVGHQAERCVAWAEKMPAVSFGELMEDDAHSRVLREVVKSLSHRQSSMVDTTANKRLLP